MDIKQRHISEVVAAIDEENFPLAEGLLSKLLNLYPDDRQIIPIYLDLLFKTSRFDDLLNFLRGIENGAHYADTLKQYALSLLSKNNRYDALRLLIECLRLCPTDYDALFLSGRCYYEMKIHEIAYQLLDEYVSKNGKNKNAYLYLGDIWLHVKKDMRQAYFYYSNALGISDAMDAYVYHCLGMSAFNLGLYDEAIRHLTHPSKIEKHLPEGLFTLCIAYVMVDRFHEARAVMRYLVMLYNDYTPVRFIARYLSNEQTFRLFRHFISSNSSDHSRSGRVAEILKRYAEEIAFVFGSRDRYWQSSNLLNDLDGLILYTLIRQLKPKHCIEFSPFRGFSTVFIYKALEKNSVDFTFKTFDLAQCSEFTEMMRLFSIPLEVRVGDAIKEVPRYIRENNLEGKIDFCFVDSCHEYDFARSYIEEIFPLLGDDCVIAIHDMYYKPDDITLPFDHYAPIRYSNICENPASIGEAKALREYFCRNDKYILFSTHRLFGGIGHCCYPIPLNNKLLSGIGTDLHFLDAGLHWSQAPMLIIAIPKGMFSKKDILFNTI
ncbi:MAG: class I SAM-dependent methyltransferase [Thermodesulfovibrionales bacterium]